MRTERAEREEQEQHGSQHGSEAGKIKGRLTLTLNLCLIMEAERYYKSGVDGVRIAAAAAAGFHWEK